MDQRNFLGMSLSSTCSHLANQNGPAQFVPHPDPITNHRIKLIMTHSLAALFSLFFLAAVVPPPAAPAASSSGEGVAFTRVQTVSAWEAVLKQARDTGKPLFVDAYTTWCPPCKALDRYVFSTKEVGEFLNTGFIPVKIDMEKGFGLEFADTYAVEAYPTLFVIGSEGEELQRLVGYHKGESLIRALAEKAKGKG